MPDATGAVARRDDAIDRFFDAMDAERPEAIRDALADDFRFRTLSGTFEGVAGLREYVEEERSIDGIEHETTGRVHGGDAAVVEGVATGRKDGEPFEARFCNVFDFEGGDLAQVRVYLRRA